MTRRRRFRRGWLVALASGAALLGVGPSEAAAQDVGRRAVERLRFPELRFEPPVPEEHQLAGGTTVYLLEDRALPLVTILARFDGGYSHFGRPYYAAGTALPALVRGGGTTTLAPDSVDRLFEYYAIQTTFGGAGESTFSSMNTLTENLDEALAAWGGLLRDPGFDSSRVEVWRGQELENVLRRQDDPARLAFTEFNRLMYGDHPIGWEMEPADLSPERLSPERLSWMHRRLMCPGNLVLGVTGDVSWNEIRPRLEALLADWPPCAEPLPETPLPDIRSEPGVFLIPRELEQSTIVLAHGTELRQEDSRDYFASRIGNSILGASGFRSRLLARVRTEEGLAYSASSLWTAPVRYGGLVGATTRTKAESTVATIDLIREVLEEMTDEAPAASEVETAIEEATNGFVFNFDSPSQVISRRMFYQASGLRADWLERYLEGIQRVRPGDVLSVFRQHVRPDELVILVVGDPARFDEPLASLGEVTILDVGVGATGPAPDTGAPDAGPMPERAVSARPSGSRRSPG